MSLGNLKNQRKATFLLTYLNILLVKIVQSAKTSINNCRPIDKEEVKCLSLKGLTQLLPKRL